MAEISREEWLAALDEARETSQPKGDPESLTRAELQDLFGLQRSRTDERIKQMLKLGSVERTQKAVALNDGRVRLVPSYRLVKKAPTNGKRRAG